ncbi:MAG: class I SAM-dependent methyltransferase [Thermoproteota archaeon]|nr:class I SAM-dependent methyltransferase [Thermoproteota archaeon]
MCTGLKGDILEIGSGMGTFSEKIISRSSPHSRITLTDVSLSYVKKLEEWFLNMAYNDSCKNIKVCKLDLNCEEDYDLIGYRKFDSIIAINVLEHVENDEFALQQLYDMLRKGGRLFLLVPCHKFLYNVIDQEVGHFRRYVKSELEHKAKNNQFTIERMFYFNMLGIIGWYINGNLARRPKIDGTASKIFDRLVPISKYIEKTTHQRMGLSIICYLSKN